MTQEEFERRFEAWRKMFEAHVKENPGVLRWSVQQFIDFIMGSMAGPMTVPEGEQPIGTALGSAKKGDILSIDMSKPILDTELDPVTQQLIENMKATEKAFGVNHEPEKPKTMTITVKEPDREIVPLSTEKWLEIRKGKDDETT